MMLTVWIAVLNIASPMTYAHISIMQVADIGKVNVPLHNNIGRT